MHSDVICTEKYSNDYNVLISTEGLPVILTSE